MGEQQPQPHYYTPAEYFALEEQGEVRHEYFGGEVFAMAGATKAHNLLSKAMMNGLDAALLGRQCRVFIGDVRVVIKENHHYVYPDVVVSCDPDDERDDLLVRKPLLIVEVLSDSTAAYDRSDKFKHYRQLASLRYYVLIHQNRWLVEWFHREEPDKWVYHSLDSPTDVLEIAELNLQLPLADLYAATNIAPLRLTPPPGEEPR
ncbi:Uma2 family endonuclease [Hymenobacter sp. ASUV-10]|uniref:Uma2 family endonuclease n=1 Tax=Hymenobacter aranciens TaxID=3063996 RepID=A0ABT9BBG7_9BACT|nr:Uma2 family endonuclease [Hymenobacter sp. ASUV-10]MDO7875609.1 Uma2 family endonuclease [Hymenobacter sp. ASUV-10]